MLEYLGMLDSLPRLKKTVAKGEGMAGMQGKQRTNETKKANDHTNAKG